MDIEQSSGGRDAFGSPRLFRGALEIERFGYADCLPAVAPVTRALGMSTGEERESFVVSRTEMAMRAAGVRRITDYAAMVAAGERAEAERRRLVELLTVGETYFFRERSQLERVIVSCRIALSGKRDKALRVLSAGCSTGEEAYTVAILLREAFGTGEVDWHVTGWDVNPAAVKAARAGLYPLGERSLQHVGQAALLRHFEPAGERMVRPVEELRRAVSFEERNLLAPRHEGPAFDIILCRNVLIYFTPEARRAAVAALRGRLAPAGCFFVGASDHFDARAHGFLPCREGGGRCYRPAPESPPGVAVEAPHARCAPHLMAAHGCSTPIRDLPPEEFEIERIGGVSLVRVRGLLEKGGPDAARFEQTLDRLRLDSALNVAFSLGEVTFLDQAWIGRLLRFLKECRQGGGEVRLCDVPPAVREFLARHLVDRLLDLDGTAAEALSRFEGSGRPS